MLGSGLMVWFWAWLFVLVLGYLVVWLFALFLGWGGSSAELMAVAWFVFGSWFACLLCLGVCVSADLGGLAGSCWCGDFVGC